MIAERDLQRVAWWDAFVELLQIHALARSLSKVEKHHGPAARAQVEADVRAVLLGMPRARMLTDGHRSRSG